MVKKLYPFGKAKAFNVTYDDGILQDVRFVELLNKYNLKSTKQTISSSMINTKLILIYNDKTEFGEMLYGYVESLARL